MTTVVEAVYQKNVLILNSTQCLGLFDAGIFFQLLTPALSSFGRGEGVGIFSVDDFLG